MSGAELALSIVGAVESAVTSIIQLIDKLNPVAQGDNSEVRIAAGLAGAGQSANNLGGNIPKLFAWDDNAQPIGRFWRSPLDSSTIGEGQFADLTVDQKHFNQGGKQAIWLTVQADGADAICIAYLAQTWADGTKKAWLGDMNYVCDQAWAYSNVIVEQTDGGDYKPKCGWLDGDFSDPSFHKGMTLKMTDFSKLTSDNDFTPPSGNAICQSPTAIWYDGEYNNDVEYTAAAKKRRSIGNRRQSNKTFTGRIIGSHDPSHKASELCKSPTSWSPDFVSFAEGVLCDMTTRELWALCSGDVTTDCFDWDSKALVDGSLKKRETQYSDVTVWE